MEPTAIIEIVSALIKEGPTVVLAVVCWYLWKETKQERADHMATLRGVAADKAKTIADYQLFADTVRRLTEEVKERK